MHTRVAKCQKNLDLLIPFRDRDEVVVRVEENCIWVHARDWRKVGYFRNSLEPFKRQEQHGRQERQERQYNYAPKYTHQERLKASSEMTDFKQN